MLQYKNKSLNKYINESNYHNYKYSQTGIIETVRGPMKF